MQRPVLGRGVVSIVASMTGRYDQLMRRMRGGQQILIDGGTGSEMERRDIPSINNAWTCRAALSHPEIVRDVHVEYIEAGANVVISNTFATHKAMLRDAGLEADFAAVNRKAVEIAAEARDVSGRRDVVVAAGMSHWSFTGDEPTVDELERDAVEQAAIMAEAGAELFVLEMMSNIERMHRLVMATRTTGLPVWVGLTVGTDEGNLHTPGVMTLRSGELLVDAIAALDGLDVDLVTIMHTDVALIDPCLDVTFDAWDGPVGVYAHSGQEVDGEWGFDDVITPARYAALSSGWLDRGIHVIGGCCGTRPDHIREIAKSHSLT